MLAAGGAGDQVVVDVNGACRGLAEAASGELGARLVDAFIDARDAMLRLGPGGAVLLRCAAQEDSAELIAGLTSLCRSLAREAAPCGVRVNAIISRSGLDGPELADLVALLGSPASAMCTGAIFEVA